MDDGIIMYTKKVHQVKDIFTEDEISNLLIDIWKMEQEMKEGKPNDMKPSSGESVTVTITKDNYFK